MKSLLILGFAAILFGCENHEGLRAVPNDPIPADTIPEVPDTGNQVIGRHAIDSKIFVLAEEFVGPGKGLTLSCNTEKIYPCDVFVLNSEVELSESAIKVTFTEVLEYGFCFAMPAPARASFYLDTLANGEYDLELNVLNVRNTGKLIITEPDISLLFADQNGIEIVRSTIQRIPEKTYWGLIGYHKESSAPLVTEFIKKFEEKGANFAKQTPGHYTYYEINESGEMIVPSNHGYWFIKTLIFQYDGDESVLKDIVMVDGKNHKDDLSIRLMTYNGGYFNNWGN